MMLNSDGEIEEEQETHAERYARIVALAEVLKSKKPFCFCFLLVSICAFEDPVPILI